MSFDLEISRYDSIFNIHEYSCYLEEKFANLQLNMNWMNRKRVKLSYAISMMIQC